MNFQSREEFEAFLEANGWRKYQNAIASTPAAHTHHWAKRFHEVNPPRRVREPDPIQVCIVVYFPPQAKAPMVGIEITGENQDLEWSKLETYTIALETLNPERLQRHINGLGAAWDALNKSILVEGARLPRTEAWFEYHCFEDLSSADAELWKRSHQKVTIEGREESDGDLTFSKDERTQNGSPLTYRIRFADGFVGTACEDELLDSPTEFQRPDPP